jgi:N-acetyl sugar amidotransferase
MIRCRTCVMPNTRPDTPFIDGECSACVSYRKRATIDWGARKKELLAILDKHDGKCIVPSSGGKDSTWQVLKLLELGADVTIVTARTCHLTPIGRANIDNLARYARTIEVVPNMTVRAKLNRLALEMVGDISWPEHAAIFSTPLKMANALSIPLLFYGECPQEAYGGPPGSDEAKQMTRRWVTEFGGFLGLRPSDFVGIEGITERDMEDYEPPKESKAEAYFLGQFFGWDSRANAVIAEGAGMKVKRPSFSNWWLGENLDNAQTGIHDWFMFLKYGFGRGCQQVSVDIRAGRVTRDEGLEFVEQWDGTFPALYADVTILEVLDRIGMTRNEFEACASRFRVS